MAKHVGNANPIIRALAFVLTLGIMLALVLLVAVAVKNLWLMLV